MGSTADFEEVRALFPGAPGYLDTASIGLPPGPALDELSAAIADWRAGTASVPGYDAWVDRGRAAFADLVGVAPSHVATGSQVSAFAGVVAASLPDGAEVLCAEGDFTSVLFPFLVQRPRISVRSVPLERLAEELGAGTDLVSVSAVQSSDGRVADLDALAAAAGEHGAATLIDATQACGWLPIDASRFDYLSCSAYKWLLSPRGASFFVADPGRVGEIAPVLAGWYAAEDRWNSLYGDRMELARDTRRLDLSPAWLSWVGAAPAVELLASLGAEAIGTHAVGLANLLRERIGLPESDSAIVSVEIRGAAERLAAAGVRASVRADGVRVGFHLYSDESDVDLVVDALA
jgi:selenocysteine lyase/cysteine desulfurase